MTLAQEEVGFTAEDLPAVASTEAFWCWAEITHLRAGLTGATGFLPTVDEGSLLWPRANFSDLRAGDVAKTSACAGSGFPTEILRSP